MPFSNSNNSEELNNTILSTTSDESNNTTSSNKSNESKNLPDNLNYQTETNEKLPTETKKQKKKKGKNKKTPLENTSQITINHDPIAILTNDFIAKHGEQFSLIELSKKKKINNINELNKPDIINHTYTKLIESIKISQTEFTHDNCFQDNEKRFIAIKSMISDEINIILNPTLDTNKEQSSFKIAEELKKINNNLITINDFKKLFENIENKSQNEALLHMYLVLRYMRTNQNCINHENIAHNIVFMGMLNEHYEIIYNLCLEITSNEAKLKEQNDLLNKLNKSLLSQIHNLQSSSEAKKNQIKELKSEVKKLNKISNSTKEIKTQNNFNNVQSTQIHHKQTQTEFSNNEKINEQENAIKLMQEKISQLTKENQNLKKENNELKNTTEKLLEDNTELKQNNKKLTIQITQLTTQLQDIGNKLQQLNTETQNKSNNLEEYQQNLKKLTEELQDKKNTLTKLEKQIQKNHLTIKKLQQNSHINLQYSNEHQALIDENNQLYYQIFNLKENFYILISYLNNMHYNNISFSSQINDNLNYLQQINANNLQSLIHNLNLNQQNTGLPNFQIHTIDNLYNTNQPQTDIESHYPEQPNTQFYYEASNPQQANNSMNNSK